MLNDLLVFVYEPFAEWTEQITQWGATIVSTPEEASVIVCDAKSKGTLSNKPKILYPTVLKRMVSHGSDFTSVDFSNTLLTQGYLCGLNLMGANFTKAGLKDTSFEGSNLADVNFTGAYLQSVNFERCNLIGVTFGENFYKRDLECSFEGALVDQGRKKGSMTGVTVIGPNVRWIDEDVSEMSVRGADLSVSYFENVSMLNTDCVGVNFSGTVFVNVDCTGMDFSGANLSGTDLSGATLLKATFTLAHYDASTKWPEDFDHSSIGAIGPGTVLSGLDLSGRKFPEGLDLSNADFTGANLGGCTFENSTFTGAKFDDADCSSVSFERSDLNGASFERCNLQHANLKHTNKNGTNFSNADIRGLQWGWCTGDSYTLKNARLDNAKYDASTVWPHPAAYYQNLASPTTIFSSLRRGFQNLSEEDLYVLMSIKAELERELEERFLNSSLLIASYCLNGKLDGFDVFTQYRYDDQGGYDLLFDGVSVKPFLEHPFFKCWSFFNVEIRKSPLIKERINSITLPKLSDGYRHPMLNLFDGYTPKDPKKWSDMWTLLTSLEPDQRNQGQPLLEAYVVSDVDLRNHLVSIGLQSLHGEYCSRLFDPHLGFWYLFYIDEEEYDYDNIYSTFASTSDEKWYQVRPVSLACRGVDSLFLPVIHLALRESGADTALLLEEAEILLGKPLVDAPAEG